MSDKYLLIFKKFLKSTCKIFLIFCNLKRPEGWSNFFYLNAFVLIIGAIFFSIFASAKVQRWADPDANRLKFDYSKNRKQLPSFELLNKSKQNNLPTVLLESLLESGATKY